MSAAKGSDFWYSAAVNSLGQFQVRRVPAVLLVLDVVAQGALQHGHYVCLRGLRLPPGALSGACGVLIAAYYLYSKSKIDEGIRLKKCLRIRFPAPPLIDYSLFRWDLVTCRL